MLTDGSQEVGCNRFSAPFRRGMWHGSGEGNSEVQRSLDGSKGKPKANDPFLAVQKQGLTNTHRLGQDLERRHLKGVGRVLSMWLVSIVLTHLHPQTTLKNGLLPQN